MVALNHQEAQNTGPPSESPVRRDDSILSTMPTYVYECGTCGQVFEIVQRMAEAPLTECPAECGGHVKRLIQAPLTMVGVGCSDAPSASPFT